MRAPVRCVQYNHDHIFRKILSVLSLVLKLPPTYLWNLASNEEERFDLFRYALYHPPSPDEDAKTDGVRLQGHTDFNAVSRAPPPSFPGIPATVLT